MGKFKSYTNDPTILSFQRLYQFIHISLSPIGLQTGDVIFIRGFQKRCGIVVLLIGEFKL